MTFFYAAAGGLDHRAAAYLFRAGGGGRGVSVPLSRSGRPSDEGRHICSSGPPPGAAHLFRDRPGRRTCSPRPQREAAHLFPSPTWGPRAEVQSGASVPRAEPSTVVISHPGV